MAHSPSERIRVDLWLKHACVVKHRGEATEACRGGLVHVNEERVKPAHAVRIGDVIELSEPRYRKLVVLALPERQASKDEARSFYRDETPPPPPRELELQIAVREKGAGRPTKRQRREMDRWNKS
ncbi:MAG TPA: S4 domain-containing protein [Thermoanaerobaculia bacterium]|nr:S4 domain-containing protein [Thermoanaerobaculia bacterium]